MTGEPPDGDNARLARVIERLDQERLPSMPAVAARLNQLLCQDEFEIGDVVAVVESDTALAARLLKVTNSAAIGLRHPATSVERAVLMLGLKGVRNMAMSLALVHGFPRARSSLFDHDLFWRDSIRRAVAARTFAGHWQGCDKEEAYLGALLQDVALPMLVLSLGPEYAGVLREWTRTRRPLVDIEMEKAGWDHTQIGTWLARKWQFDEAMVSMIAQHHQSVAEPTPDPSALRCVQLSAAIPSTSTKDPQPLARLCEALRGCAPALLDTLGDDLAQIDTSFEDMCEAFQVRQAWTLPLAKLYEKIEEAG